MWDLMLHVALSLKHTLISFVWAKPLDPVSDQISSDSICPHCAMGIIMKHVNDMLHAL